MSTSTTSSISCRIVWTMAIVACAFSLLVGILLASDLVSTRIASPLDTPGIEQLRAAFKANPADPSVAARVRELDWIARTVYFKGLAAKRSGVLILLGGVIIAMVSLRVAVSLSRRQVPDPRQYPMCPGPEELESTARWTIAGVIVAVLIISLYFGVFTPNRMAGISTSNSVPAPVTSKERKNQPASVVDVVYWPAFRGSSGSGLGVSSNPPIAWDGTSGGGVLWKTAIPLPGNSSPVVAGNKIYLTGATSENRQVYCLDCDKGTILWTADVKGVGTGVKTTPEIFQDTGFAAPTPVTDGMLVYSLFANGDLVALDHCSLLKWSIDLGVPNNRYGQSSSLCWYQGKVLIQYDQDAEKGVPSRLLALDGATGKTVWSVLRPVSDSWPSPVLLDTAKGTQLITVANDSVIAYDPGTGRELWKIKCSGSDVAPSPILAGGLVIVSITGDKVYAIRPDGNGDVTDTHVAWTSTDGVTDVPSPVSDGELVYLVHSSGTMVCLEATTGKKIWEHSLDGEFYGSPGIAGNKLYCVARNGTVFVLKTGRQYEEIGKSVLGEPSDGSPVFVKNRIILRGLKNLFCIGQ